MEKQKYCFANTLPNGVTYGYMVVYAYSKEEAVEIAQAKRAQSIMEILKW